MTTPLRDYEAILARHGLTPARPHVHAPEDAPAVMRRAVDMLWGALGSSGLSWIGFYDKVPDADEMILVCREPKPACSPIGLHGLCGRSWREARPYLVDDVRTLGANYIACDPRDQSELVIPLVRPDGACRGVLDVDSHDRASFTEHDAAGMIAVLNALSLTTLPPGTPVCRL